jgi:hypothetical protein
VPLADIGITDSFNEPGLLARKLDKSRIRAIVRNRTMRGSSSGFSALEPNPLFDRLRFPGVVHLPAPLADWPDLPIDAPLFTHLLQTASPHFPFFPCLRPSPDLLFFL